MPITYVIHLYSTLVALAVRHVLHNQYTVVFNKTIGAVEGAVKIRLMGLVVERHQQK